ncbi:metal ABC transporter permease [Streptomyces bobili]|uniref:metal ABC transporter permease n=1 Tax=Streptomyces bobili TaxID=67280 RepID=UPI0022541931|nr:metal ABC transporter permease [Streptomyces bobili]MCX5522002.1 metal ABC transporter permease [Streptomyces bobili]
MRDMRRVQRVAVAVVLAATPVGVAGGGAAVADDSPARTAGAGLGRIAYEDGVLTLDPADGAHVIEVGGADVADASAPGWDTTGVSEGAVAGDTVRWSLTGLHGPGELKVYSAGNEEDGDTAEDVRLFDSADDLPDEHRLPVGPVAGLYVSYTYDLAAGGSVVVVLTGLFVLTWCLAPRHGLIAKRLRRSDGAALVPAGR